MSDVVSFPLDIQVFLCFPVFPATVMQGDLNCVQPFEVCPVEHISSDFSYLGVPVLFA